jgi:hypothetical protein
VYYLELVHVQVSVLVLVKKSESIGEKGDSCGRERVGVSVGSVGPDLLLHQFEEVVQVHFAEFFNFCLKNLDPFKILTGSVALHDLAEFFRVGFLTKSAENKIKLGN